MIVGGRNPAKYTDRRVGVCVICTKNITSAHSWSTIKLPATGKVHDDCIPKEGR